MTIHELDACIDTGKILFRRHVPYTPANSFREIYNRYRTVTKDMIIHYVTCLRTNCCFTSDTHIPSAIDVFNLDHWHKAKDAEPLLRRLPHGWDTTIQEARSFLRNDISEYIDRARANLERQPGGKSGHE